MTTTQVSTELPRWDMEVVYPSIDSEDFVDAFEGLVRRIEKLSKFSEESPLEAGKLDAPNIGRFDSVVGEINEIYDLMREVRGYVNAFITTEAANDEAQGRNSELATKAVFLSKVETRLTDWIGTIDVEALISSSEVASSHEFWVRRAAEYATHLMPAGEEDLALSLGPSGRAAWAKLHGNVTARLMVDFRRPDGSVERLPMAAVRGMGDDPDPAVREASYHAQMETWPSVEVPLAAALNSIKGWENELNERRGWPDSIEPALFNNNVDRPTLEAMQEACIESFPDFGRYFAAKARLLGKERLPWYDLGAPVGGQGSDWSWDGTAEFIVDNFRTYSDSLAGLAARARPTGPDE
jgi:oligoendopeptidase F